MNTGINAEDLLYPEIVPNKSGWKTLDDVHSMYWEESGIPEGLPALVLHGGPAQALRLGSVDSSTHSGTEL